MTDSCVESLPSSSTADFFGVFAVVCALVAAVLVSAVPAVASGQTGSTRGPVQSGAEHASDDPTADSDPGLVIGGNIGDQGLGWTVELSGYIRAQYTAIQDDPNFDAFGRHDGFSLPDARLGVSGHLDNGFGFKVQVNTTAGLPNDGVASATTGLATRLKDGYLFYRPHPLFRVSAGQFKAPFDIEELISTPRILFIQRSVGNRGVHGVEGFDRPGLSEGRQLGIRVDADPFYFGGDDDGPGLSYAGAATNGQAANVSLNDNDKLAYFGRLNLHWGDLVRLGAAGYHNARTLGQRPNRIGETRTGWTADVTVRALGFTLLANVIQTKIDPGDELTGEPQRTARAYQVQIAYEEPFWGLQPAYRFAVYDPTADDVGVGGDRPSPFESLTYHTIGLNYNAQTWPVRVMLNYTLTGEQTYAIDNDRLDALVQLQW